MSTVFLLLDMKALIYLLFYLPLLIHVYISIDVQDGGCHAL
jgi:hypothetical protein